MNRSAIEKYARKARKEFIASVVARARAIGLTKESAKAVETSGSVVVNGIPLTQVQARAYNGLVSGIQYRGFDRVMDEAAYTWFNRFVAIRYMEIHDWLPCGCFILGEENNTTLPAILGHVADIDKEMFPYADIQRMHDLRVAGNREEELYRLLLVAQCNALSSAMPLVFEPVSDSSELLLPDNLLASNGLIRNLVESIPKEDWEDVEIFGWLYQYYISERKDAVIGKVVASEDIPAATQLFTPNWIVQYMVQNTLGRMWLATYPHSSIREDMPYYVDPAEQTEEIQAQLESMIPKDLDPESITFLDPACGSGHILVEAYNLLKKIYTERGFCRRDIPRTILEKNLFGIDIDPRAAQLTQLSLLMLARKDDRRILSNPPRMSIVALKSSADILKEESRLENIAEILRRMSPQTVVQQKPQQLSLLEQDKTPEQGLLPSADAFSVDEVLALVGIFKDADTFGSLIQIPDNIKKILHPIRKAVEMAEKRSVTAKGASFFINPFLFQAEILAKQYDCVVANPPYMGNKGMNAKLRDFAQMEFLDGKSDLFAMFMERCLSFIKKNSRMAMVTMQSWMFLSSFKSFRKKLLTKSPIENMLHMGNGVMGIAFGTSATIFRKGISLNIRGKYCYAESDDIFEGKPKFFPPHNERNRLADKGFYTATAKDFEKIPGSPIAYWVSEKTRRIFAENSKLGDVAEAAVGLQTGDNNRFLRLWFEISYYRIGFRMSSSKDALASELKWFPYNKGGFFRKWYGNMEYVVNWENDGREIINCASSSVKNIKYYFKKSISWSKISSSKTAFRLYDGFIFDVAGTSLFLDDYFFIISLLNSNVISLFLKILSPTMNFEVGQVIQIPIIKIDKPTHGAYLIALSRSDWDSFETAWDFKTFPMLLHEHHKLSIADSYASVRSCWQSRTIEMRRLEEENNHIFNEAYGLEDKISSDVPLKEITLTCNPWYRYGEDESEYRTQGEDILAAKMEELENHLRSDTMKELISYALGCMMGRYSLDKPGIVYAEEGGRDFNPNLYQIFPADDDGIVPMLDNFWFDDDFAHRFTEFVRTVWGEKTLQENLKFVADQLNPKVGEFPEATIRRWLSTKFYKECHLKMYRNRPIYWLFSSGKQKAFEALVYLHRMGPNTIARMRTHYIGPLSKRLIAEIERLDASIDALSGSTARKAEKERDILRKKQIELRGFDDKLRHYEDLNITLNLDDGVRVNYGKYRDILAEAKTVTKE